MARRGPPVGRLPAVKVRSARRRKPSSTRWLSRQLNDPYVAEARRLGYRSRAAFKLVELDQRFRLLRPGHRVVDLGCAPGGWTQVAVARSPAGRCRHRPRGITPLPGATFSPETSATPPQGRSAALGRSPISC
jgi:23S rRNA (uridine2552-2'-O)-methyltransferase